MKKQNNKQVKAVVFDMDGVLIDSRELIYRAMEDVLIARQVHDLTREKVAEVIGKPVHAMYAILAPHLDAYELERDHLEHHAQNPHLLQEYEGVEQVLIRLKELGCINGVFTGFDEGAYGRLEQFGLRKHFEYIVESTQYTEHKPHPEGLLLCMDKLGVSAGETIYIGDGVSDMLAGQAANVRATIGITQGFGSKEALESAGADYIIDSLFELEGVIDRIEQ